MLLAHRCRRLGAGAHRRLLLLAGSRRALASGPGVDESGNGAVTFPNVGQGGCLHVRILRVPIQIKIKSAWIDHTELRVEAPPSAPALEVTEEAGSTTTRGEPGAVVVSDAKLGFAPNALLGLPEPYRLTATVPEKFNLQLRIQSTGIRHGAILPTTTSDEEAVVEIAGKVEGDVEVFVRHGDVRVGKLRGPRIELGAEHGCVFVDKYVEGDIAVRAQRLHARMLKGSRIRVQVSNPGGPPPPAPPAPEGYESSSSAEEEWKEEVGPAPVTVEALFGNRASVLCTSLPQEERARRAVDITRSHGEVKVVVTGGGVHLGGVNGSATVQTVDGPLDVRFEALAPGTANTLATRRGRVELLMAPEVKAALEVEGFSQRAETLVPPEGPSGFKVTSQMGSRLEGRFTGKPPAPSRKALKDQQQQGQQQQQHNASPPPSAHGKGKIDLSGAEAQALKSFFADREGGGGGGGGARPLQPTPKEPTILVKLGGGQLSVRTISWMDAIKRQFGLSHIDYSVRPKA